jgi:D-3-phosphoglycerate dehydrogenase
MNNGAVTMSQGNNTTIVAVLGARWSLEIEADELAGLGVELVQDLGTTADDIVNTAREAVAILAGSPPKFDREVLSRLPSLKVIARYGVGVDKIDVSAATDLGIMVTNLPDVFSEEVATHTLALILATMRKIVQSHQLAVSGRWEVAPLKPFFSTENQVLGIVGLGNIGQAVARKAQSFGFEMLVYDPYLSPEVLAQFDIIQVDLQELLVRSDIIALTAPHTDETHHMINTAALKKMKPSALLVNTSRGSLIDEAALEEALENGWIAGAGLDVMENEPVKADRTILKSDKLTVTPHTAWYTEQAMERMRRQACQEVARVLRGERPKNLVKP